MAVNLDSGAFNLALSGLTPLTTYTVRLVDGSDGLLPLDTLFGLVTFLAVGPSTILNGLIPLSIKVRGYDGPARFEGSVGIGMYRIDLHPSTGGDNYIDVECAPFEIPLGALVPVRTQNLLPAAKNIGTTHITNGAYRLHPVEWNIGESAGELAAFCLDRGLSPQQVARDPALVEQLQARLVAAGVELSWPEIIGYEQRNAQCSQQGSCSAPSR